MVRKRSCPAVSQICNLMVFPSNSMVRIFCDKIKGNSVWEEQPNNTKQTSANKQIKTSSQTHFDDCTFVCVASWDSQSQHQWWKCRIQCRYRQQIAKADTIYQHPSLQSREAWTNSRWINTQNSKEVSVRKTVRGERTRECVFMLSSNSKNRQHRRVIVCNDFGERIVSVSHVNSTSCGPCETVSIHFHFPIQVIRGLTLDCGSLKKNFRILASCDQPSVSW